MKLSKKIVLFITVLSMGTYQSFSQTEITQDYEGYSRENNAFTNFRVLGINNNQFAKCVESVNYFEPSKTQKLVIIEGVQYADDGKNFDLIASDGILTSIQLSTYTDGAVILPPGKYRMTKNNYLIHDVNFLHAGKTSGDSPQPDGFSISCKLMWVKCSSWPMPYREFCRDFSWPFNGGFEFVECTIKFE